MPAIRMFLAVLAIGVIWLIVLPAAARHPAVQVRSRLYESLRVNVGAMVYTELDVADDARSAWRSARRAHPVSLWRPQSNMRLPPDR